MVICIAIINPKFLFPLNISTHEITQNEWSHTWNQTVESTEKSDRDIVRVSWPVQITKVSL